MGTNTNIHTEFHRMLGRDAKESQLNQRGHVFGCMVYPGQAKVH